MENNNHDEIEIDLLELFFVFKRKLWIILLAGFVCALGMGLFTKFMIQPMYSSTSKLYILSSSTSLTSLADIQIGTSLTKDYVQLAQSRPVVEQVIENLKLNRTYEEVLEQVKFTNPSDTRILVITVEDPDPVLAKDMADQFAEVSRDQISVIMKTEAPSVVEMGYVNEEPVSPNLMKNTVIGGLLGVVLSMGVIFVLYMMDDTVKTTEDVEKYLKLNTLTAVPLREGEKKSHRRKNRGGQKNGK